MPCKDATEPTPGTEVPEPVVTPNLFVYDAAAESVVGGGRQVIFTVAAAPANQASNITFTYATSNGTASAGTHYTSKSGTGTIPVGTASVDIAVDVREPTSAAGTTKSFTLTISAPVNAVIADATATGTIAYEADGSGGGGPSIPDWEKAAYSSVAPTYVPVYDQFRSYNNVTGPDHNDAQCVSADENGCTGYSAALMMSIGEYKIRHNPKVGFRARKILTDSGFVVGGSTWYDYYVHLQLTSGVGGSTAGALTCDGVRRTLQNVVEITDDTTLSTTALRWADLAKKIKRRIVLNHCVYVSGVFYGIWNTSEVEPYLYLRTPSSWTTSSGHSWIFTGWNDNVTVNGRNIGGAFRVQSSHGRAWGDGGRAWLPYSILINTFPGGSAKRRRSQSQGYPWFRFFFPVW